MKTVHPYPLARVGLIGGGQLGRMIVKAAKSLGCVCVVLDPVPGCPAGQIAARQIIGAYHDAGKIRELADDCDVLTFELEDIGADTLAELEAAGHRVHPSASVLQIIQDKLTQKQFLQRHGIPTSEFEEVVTPSLEQFRNFGFPLVQKARRGGYDGRGVAVMVTEAAYAKHLPGPSLIERFVEAEKEIAVVVARSTKGEIKTYPVVELCMDKDENLLNMLLAPADVDHDVREQADAIAIRTVEALGGVGVFGVEMFVDQHGRVLVNEVAPRTHNSGHHTIEANVTDQFEQHLRAILGLPLGSTEMLCSAAMINLLGAPGESGRPVLRGLDETLAIPGVCIHLYGKATTSPFRKMGHITILDRDIAVAKAKALLVLESIEIGSED